MLQKSETTRAEALSTALQKSRTGDMEDAKRRNKNKKANKKSNSKNQSKKNQSKKQGKSNGNDGNNGMEVEDMGDDDGDVNMNGKYSKRRRSNVAVIIIVSLY